MGNLHLVTGYSGAPHVASSDQGSLYEALIRSGQFVLDAGAKFAASIVSNNQIRVNDGELMMQGRYVKLTPGAYVDLAVENGTQGYLRTDLVVARYTKNAVTGVEECSLVVIKGTPAESNPADPEYTTGNLNAEGTLQHDFPLYRVSISGLVLEGLTALFEPEKSLFDYVNKNFAPAGFGLGNFVDIPTLRDIDNPPGNGWFYYQSGNMYACVLVVGYAKAKVTEVMYDYYIGYPTIKMRVKYTTTGWSEWEWINPPMTANVEYRTTERYHGAVVYKKVDGNGNLLWRKEGETKWRLLSTVSYVAAATVE